MTIPYQSTDGLIRICQNRLGSVYVIGSHYTPDHHKALLEINQCNHQIHDFDDLECSVEESAEMLVDDGCDPTLIHDVLTIFLNAKIYLVSCEEDAEKLTTVLDERFDIRIEYCEDKGFTSCAYSNLSVYWVSDAALDAVDP